MDAVLHALSDGSRRTVLEALRQGEATVSELAALLPSVRAVQPLPDHVSRR